MSQQAAQAEDNKPADTNAPANNASANNDKKGPGRPKASNSNTADAKKSSTAKKSAGRPKKSATAKSNAKSASAKQNQARTNKDTGTKSSSKRGRPAGSTSRNTDNASNRNEGFSNANNAAFGNANAFNKGLEGLSASFMQYAQNQMEENVQAAQQLLNCRSIEDMTNIQTQFIQQSFDRFIQQTNKMAQSAANLAKETAEPLNAQMEGFMQRMSGR